MSFNDSSWTGSRSRSISSHHIHHSSSCVCVCVCVCECVCHTWLPCCLLTMHVFISSMCVYVCVWCRKTITIRIIDREEYNKQSSFYVLLDTPQWRRSRKEKTGVRASQHPESQINGPTVTEKIKIRDAKSLPSKHQQKGRAIYLFCPTESPVSKKKWETMKANWAGERAAFGFILLYANLMGETRVHLGCHRNEHFPAGSGARTLQWNQNSSCFYIVSQVTKCSAAPQPLLFLQACWYGTRHALEWFCCPPLHLWFLFCTFLYRKLGGNPLFSPFSFLFFWPECIFPPVERVYIQLHMVASQIKGDIRFMFRGRPRGFWCLYLQLWCCRCHFLLSFFFFFFIFSILLLLTAFKI